MQCQMPKFVFNPNFYNEKKSLSTWFVFTAIPRIGGGAAGEKQSVGWDEPAISSRLVIHCSSLNTRIMLRDSRN